MGPEGATRDTRTQDRTRVMNATQLMLPAYRSSGISAIRTAKFLMRFTAGVSSGYVISRRTTLYYIFQSVMLSDYHTELLVSMHFAD